MQTDNNTATRIGDRDANLRERRVADWLSPLERHSANLSLRHARSGGLAAADELAARHKR